eukprot:UN4368
MSDAENGQTSTTIRHIDPAMREHAPSCNRPSPPSLVLMTIAVGAAFTSRHRSSSAAQHAAGTAGLSWCAAACSRSPLPRWRSPAPGRAWLGRPRRRPSSCRTQTSCSRGGQCAQPPSICLRSLSQSSGSSPSSRLNTHK